MVPATLKSGQGASGRHSFASNLGLVVLSKPRTPSAMLWESDGQVPRVLRWLTLHIFPSAAKPGLSMVRLSRIPFSPATHFVGEALIRVGRTLPRVPVAEHVIGPRMRYAYIIPIIIVLEPLYRSSSTASAVWMLLDEDVLLGRTCSLLVGFTALQVVVVGEAGALILMSLFV